MAKVQQSLKTQVSFVAAFAAFKKEFLSAALREVTNDQIIKLFDVWLGNIKDERFLTMQQEMQQAQLKNDNNDDEPWKRGYND